MKIKSMKGMEAAVEYQGDKRWSIKISSPKVSTVGHLQRGAKKGISFKHKGHPILFQVSPETFSVLVAEEERKDQEVREKAYAPLVEKLPDLPAGEQTLTAEEVKILKKEIKHLQEERAKFTGEEDDGIRLSFSSRIGELREKLHAGCAHEWQIEYLYGYTHDARKELRRIATCPKCGTRQEDVVSEPVLAEAMWR